jgi:hypothetical protein
MIPVDYKDKLYKLFKDDDMFHIYSNIMCITHDKISYKDNNDLFIDVFYGRPNLLNGKIVFDHNNFICNYLWPNEYYYLDELFPLRKYKFGAYEVFGANKYHKFMERNFSKKWNKEAVISHSHSKKLKKPIIFTMNPEDYEPAKPFFVPT